MEVCMYVWGRWRVRVRRQRLQEPCTYDRDRTPPIIIIYVSKPEPELSLLCREASALFYFLFQGSYSSEVQGSTARKQVFHISLCRNLQASVAIFQLHVV